MEVLPAILTLYFVFVYLSSLTLFVKRAVLAVAAFWCTSVDVMTNGSVFTYIFIASCAAYLLLTTPVTATEILLFSSGLTACVFFLNMSEFKDGYALSHVVVSVAIALYSFAVFSPLTRKSMAITMLFVAMAFTSSRGIPFRPYEIITAFFVVSALTENFSTPRGLPLSRDIDDKKIRLSLA